MSLGTDVLELCESTIEKTPPIEIVAADVRNKCAGEPRPVLCARANIRELRSSSLDGAAHLGVMADYHLDLAWGVEPRVAHGLRTRCPLAQEHLLEMVKGLDSLLREVDDPNYWEPQPEPVSAETEHVEARRIGDQSQARPIAKVAPVSWLPSGRSA